MSIECNKCLPVDKSRQPLTVKTRVEEEEGHCEVKVESKRHEVVMEQWNLVGGGGLTVGLCQTQLNNLVISQGVIINPSPNN